MQLKPPGNEGGIWSVSRLTGNQPESETVEWLSAIAVVAGTTLAVIREAQLLAGMNSDERSTVVVSKFIDAVPSELYKIGLRLNAQFVAYFRWSHETSRLEKVSEIFRSSDANSPRNVAYSGCDDSYAPSGSLTGCALSSDKYLYISFFDHLIDKEPSLVDEASVKWHKNIAGKNIHSVMYCHSDPAIGAKGLVRVINTNTINELPFTRSEFDLLRLMTKQLDHNISSITSSEIFSRLQATFQQAMMLTNTTTEVVSGLSDTLAVLGAGPLSESSRPAMSVDATEYVRLVRDDFHESNVERGTNLLTASYKVGLPSSGAKERNALISLKHVGALCLEIWKYSHVLRQKTDLIRAAETSIGEIAHESREPSVALGSLALSLANTVIRVAEPLASTKIPHRVVVLGKDSETLKLATFADFVEYAKERKRAITERDLQLHQIVVDGLQWAELVGNASSFTFVRCDLVDIIQSVVRRKADEAAAEHKQIVVHSSGGTSGVLLVCCEHQITRLINNLVDNAVKYSFSSSQIVITVKTEASCVQVTIQNFGMGIASDEIESVFQPYFRSTIRDTRHKRRGVGLGLAICRKIVEYRRVSR